MSRRPPAPPAALPLPGRQPAASLTLQPLLCGEIAMPPNWFERGRGPIQTLEAFGIGVPASGLRTILVPAYLLEHPTVGQVLVDKREWRAAWARDRHLHGYATAQLDRRPSYRTLHFSSPSARAHGPFERTLDLFGEGSLLLASTPGHTAGHLSLIARLEHREALLTADAAYTLATIRDGRRPWLTHNRKAFEHSLRQIQAYDREHPDAIVIPGHDLAAWNVACAAIA